jgi:hypothetical protein
MLHGKENAAIKRPFTTDPVKFRVALLAADPPDHAKPACHLATAQPGASAMLCENLPYAILIHPS